MSFGIFSWIAGALQLSVPSYALRLIRRFGSARVGWFVVAAFLSLAMLHLLSPSGRSAPPRLRDCCWTWCTLLARRCWSSAWATSKRYAPNASKPKARNNGCRPNGKHEFEKKPPTSSAPTNSCCRKSPAAMPARRRSRNRKHSIDSSLPKIPSPCGSSISAPVASSRSIKPHSTNTDSTPRNS